MMYVSIEFDPGDKIREELFERIAAVLDEGEHMPTTVDNLEIHQSGNLLGLTMTVPVHPAGRILSVMDALAIANGAATIILDQVDAEWVPRDSNPEPAG